MKESPSAKSARRRRSAGRTLLGRILVSRHLITGEQLALALQEQRAHQGEKIGRILIRLGFVTPSQVFRALVWQLQKCA